MTRIAAKLTWPAYRLLAALSIWALHFGVIYGVTGLACGHNPSASLPWVIGVATVAAVIASLALIVRGWSGSRPLGAADRTAVAAAVVGLVAILWQASPLLWTQRCA